MKKTNVKPHKRTRNGKSFPVKGHTRIIKSPKKRMEKDINFYEEKYLNTGYEMAKEHHWMFFPEEDLDDIMKKADEEDIPFSRSALEYVYGWLETLQWEHDVGRHITMDIRELNNIPDEERWLDEQYFDQYLDIREAWVDGYLDYVLEIADDRGYI